MDSSNKLIVALDVDSFADMQRIVQAIGPDVSTYKIGHQLFTAEGPQTIAYLKDLGKAVFLDLKLHEIPNSVAQAVQAAGQHGVSMLTVHASGGAKMMQAAVQAASHFPELKILALTVVTGLSDHDLATIGFAYKSADLGLHLATLAKTSGCHGVIASPQEVGRIRRRLGDECLIVTPGVRLTELDGDDQARTGTPRQALLAGASHVIVGRPVIQADNPALAVRRILETIKPDS